jgi:glucosylceramidase
VSYYIIAHASKFVRPGAVRISSDNVAGLPNVAFKNTDGSTV